VARLVFGWFAERRISSAAILVFTASGMATGLIVIANFSPGWPLWIFYCAIAFTGCTGNGWVGLLFAELSRLAPEGRAADVTGGAQVFMYAGVFVTPLACSTALELTDSNYDVVFLILTLLAFGSVFLLEWGRRAGN
jgi:MFS family permease